MKEVNLDMTIKQAIDLDERVLEVLQGIGMHCMHCAISSGETLREAAEAHGIDANEFLEKINSAIK